MCREVDRLEHMNMDSRAIGGEDECGEAKTGTPTRSYEPSIDVALQPAAFEPIKLMIVWAAWSKSSVRG
jgi:hypothetical protein